MSDLDLTSDEWRMCRQAGASFTDDTTGEQDLGENEQLAMDELGPRPGECYMNVHTQEVGVVLTAVTRRKSWVSIRRGGHVTEVPLDWLGEHWKPCRPDGTLR